MKRGKYLGAILLSLVLTTGAFLDEAFAKKSRKDVVIEAEKYATHEWKCEEKNAHNCFKPPFKAGVKYKGVAYRWGGFDTIEDFMKKLKDGYRAGAKKAGGTNPCCWTSTGIDCSGAITRWAYTGRIELFGKRGFVGKHGTWSLVDASKEITLEELKEGDILLRPGKHVMLFEKWAPQKKKKEKKKIALVFHATADPGKPGPKDGGPRRVMYETEEVGEDYTPRRLDLLPPKVVKVFLGEKEYDPPNPEEIIEGISTDLEKIVIKLKDPKDPKNRNFASGFRPNSSFFKEFKKRIERKSPYNTKEFYPLCTIAPKVKGEWKVEKDGEFGIKLIFTLTENLKENTDYEVCIKGEIVEFAGNYLDGNTIKDPNDPKNANGQDHHI
jgi:hypothetical protein